MQPNNQPIKIEHYLSKETTAITLASSKKKALEYISTLMCEHYPALQSNVIFDALVAREKLGSTGIGHGVAIPHARTHGITEAMGALIVLKEGVDFDSYDRIPVDIIFALIVPIEATDSHLELLSEIASKFSSIDFRAHLRRVHSNDELYEYATC